MPTVQILRERLLRLLAFLVVIVLSATSIPSVSADELLSLDSLSRLEDGVEERTLSNGMKVLFFRRPSAPVFAGIASVRVGGVNELPGKTGASHLFEHMAFKGSSVIGTRDFALEEKLLASFEELKALEQQRELSAEEQQKLAQVTQQLEEVWDIPAYSRLSRKWGSTEMNATTAKELTNYFASFPVSAFEFWAWSESERLLNPVMRQFYKEKDVVLEERRMRYDNRPGGKLYEQLLSQAFLVHPYRNPVIGYPDDLKTLVPDDVRSLHKKYYVASNIVLGVVGDLKLKKILPVLERYFGRFPEGPRPQQPDIVEPPQDGERKFSVKHDAEPIFYIGYRKPVFPHPDEAAMTVYLEWIMGHRISPLFKRIVLEKRISSSIGYFEAPGHMSPNLMFLYGDPIAPHTNEQVIAELDKGLEEFSQKLIPDEELTTIQRTMMKGALGSLQSNMGLASGLVQTQQKYGSWRASLDWYRQLLAVTPADVQRVAQQYFQPSSRTVGTLSRNG